jgi:hypothetical protein
MKGKRYQGYGAVPHDVVADDLLGAKFIEVYSCMLFFCQLFSELISNITTYSMQNKEMAEKAARLWRAGVGSTAQNRWQTSTT